MVFQCFYKIASFEDDTKKHWKIDPKSFQNPSKIHEKSQKFASKIQDDLRCVKKSKKYANKCKTCAARAKKVATSLSKEREARYILKSSPQAKTRDNKRMQEKQEKARNRKGKPGKPPKRKCQRRGREAKQGKARDSKSRPRLGSVLASLASLDVARSARIRGGVKIPC